MKVAVLGGTRFIGPEVVRQLVDDGHDVTVIHRGQREPALPAAVRHTHVARADLQDHRDELRSLAPEVVIDMHAMTEEDARQMVAAFAGIAARSVVVSSADVYRAYGRLRGIEPGPPDPVPLGEDAPLRESLYPDRGVPKHDKTEDLARYDKLLVERVARSRADLPATILRLGLVHGPRSYRHYPTVRRMLDRRPVIFLETHWAAWRGTYAYSENVAAAIVQAATLSEAAGRVYNVGELVPLSTRAFVEELGAAAGWQGRVEVLMAERLPEEMRPPVPLDQELVLDTRRIRDELGYREPVSLVEGLRRTAEWMRSHPPGPDEPMGQLAFDYAAEDELLRGLAPSRTA